MIVKNEEKVLARCLDSVQGLVDEIIIVDTGSSDATKEIAAKYTEHLYDYNWTNDFSDARNESIRRASSKWILILDADEYVERNDIDKIKKFLAEQDPSQRLVLNVSIINYVGSSMLNNNSVESTASRVFPAQKGIFYSQPIHERLICNVGELRVKNYNFRVYHTGYTDETHTEKNKSERNLEILKNLKETRKFNAEDYFALANEYTAVMDYENALHYYQLALKDMKPTIEWYKLCIYKMANVMLSLKQYREVYELIEESILRWSNYPDFYCLKATVLNQFGFFNEANNLFEKAVWISNESAKKDSHFWLISPDYGHVIPLQSLSDHYYRRQELQQTVFFLLQILNGKPRHLDSLMRLISILTRTEDTNSIIALLNKLYPNQSLSDLTILLSISLDVGDLGLTSYYLDALRKSNMEIQTQYLLRYAILEENCDLFNRYLQSSVITNDYDRVNIMPYFLAALLWNKSEYIPLVPQESNLFFIRKLIISTINTDLTVINPTEQESKDLFDLLTELFTYKLYDAYDLILKRISSSKLINSLADYYYKNNYLELALDYYSILLDANELEAQGYVNLAFLHYNQGALDEGLAFMQQAIELQPNEIALYTVLCTNSQDRDIIERYKQKLFHQFPEYKDMELFRSL